ncbi:MAG: Hpt domain-containing protein, partial [Nitrospira sp.]|nr:Hpt domain-containing protein [Nitrospira sp.]
LSESAVMIPSKVETCNLLIKSVWFVMKLPVVKEKCEILRNDNFKKILNKGNLAIQSGNVQHIQESINKEEALTRLGGNEELFSALLQLFMITAPGLVNQLQEAINLKNLELIKQVLNSLKVTAENIGVPAVQQEVSYAESAVKYAEWERLQHSYERIRTEVYRVSALHVHA